MTFWGGRIADGGLETVGRGTEIWGREEDSLFPLSDLRRDFMGGDGREGERDCVKCPLSMSCPISYHPTRDFGQQYLSKLHDHPPPPMRPSLSCSVYLFMFCCQPPVHPPSHALLIPLP